MNLQILFDYFPHLTEQQREQFARLGPLYADWNAKINVISRKDLDQLYEHHVLHSLAIGKWIRFNRGSRVLDVGTGGGFPGIPLAILYPEVEEPATRGTVKVHVEVNTANVIDAAATGAGDGLRLALNVGAMLLAFIALIALANAPLAWLGGIEWFGSGFHINDLIGQVYGQPSVLSIQSLLGILLAPIAAVIGVPWQDALQVGSLIGQKVVLNEFVAYSELVRVQGELTDKGRLIATYALCGFANFSSIAIQIGGIGGLAPERRADLARFGLRAVLGGTLATFMTATIAGVLGGL